VEFSAYAVPAEFPDHAEAVPLGVDLDGMPDVTEMHARACGFDAAPHAFIGHFDQTARLQGGLADVEHALVSPW
jgi:hypothetical protein